ncbi:hypothetical protein B0H19DRAFT_1083693 [Mycena capillaripes]|nr:hypothetical protein B0H19DRAFT_1083693 [Mycena capillaripes]
MSLLRVESSRIPRKAPTGTRDLALSALGNNHLMSHPDETFAHAPTSWFSHTPSPDFQHIASTRLRLAHPHICNSKPVIEQPHGPELGLWNIEDVHGGQDCVNGVCEHRFLWAHGLIPRLIAPEALQLRDKCLAGRHQQGLYRVGANQDTDNARLKERHDTGAILAGHSCVVWAHNAAAAKAWVDACIQVVNYFTTVLDVVRVHKARLPVV